ncbi:MAG: hypothetical protein WCE21_02215 [Candidatus Babeliales bacterium]
MRIIITISACMLTLLLHSVVNYAMEEEYSLVDELATIEIKKEEENETLIEVESFFTDIDQWPETPREREYSSSNTQEQIPASMPLFNSSYLNSPTIRTNTTAVKMTSLWINAQVITELEEITEQLQREHQNPHIKESVIISNALLIVLNDYKMRGKESALYKKLIEEYSLNS